MRDSAAGWKLAIVEQDGDAFRACAAAIAAWLEDGVSARVEARHRSGQRPGVDRSSVHCVSSAWPADGRVARSLSLGTAILAVERRRAHAKAQRRKGKKHVMTDYFCLLSAFAPLRELIG